MITVEGTTLSVCMNCVKFGDQTGVPLKKRPGVSPDILRRLEARKRRMTVKDIYSTQGEEILADDFAERIRKARERKGWKQAELGAMVNERVSIIAKLESGETPAAKKASAAIRPLTLGDLIRVEKE